MKNKLIMISISAAFLLVLASFPSSTATKNIVDERYRNKLELLESLKEQNTNEKWFPGFLIVQLIKGVIAFVLMLMILLDLAVPGDS